MKKYECHLKKNLVVINTGHYLNGLKKLRFENMVLKNSKNFNKFIT